MISQWEALNQEVADLAYAHLYDRAVVVAKEALDIAERTQGPNHPDVAANLNDLAQLYSELDKYDEAIPLCERAIRIQEDSLGPDHPELAESILNFANVYFKMHQYNTAETLYKRALSIREDTFGTEVSGS